MNVVGQTYLAFKQLVGTGSRPDSRREALTQQFLDEWESYKSIDSDKQLQNLLTYTSVHVPFYRKYFAAHPHLSPDNLKDWPVLSRATLRESFTSLKTDVPRDIETWDYSSGGSSGYPVTVVHDERFAAKAQALRDLCAKLFFDGPYFNKLVLWGSSEELNRQKHEPTTLVDDMKDQLRKVAGIKTSHVDTFDLDSETFSEIIHILRDQEPEFILGYACSVYQLARHIDSNNIRVPRSVKKIATTAHTLYPFMREQIEKVFGCAVCDYYGSRETGPVGWQHPNGDMYFPKFFSHVDVVDDAGNDCLPGEEGRILLTGLHNYSMPLIRYDTGDIGIRSMDSWYRNYPFATLKCVRGRSSDEFSRKDGSLVQGLYFVTLLYKSRWVREFCVIQKSLSLIEILVVLKPEYRRIPTDDVHLIEYSIKEMMLDNHIHIEWKTVEKVPRTRAGARYFVRSEVNADTAWQADYPPPASLA